MVQPIVADCKGPASRPQGFRVCCPTKPDWDVGHVLAEDGGTKVTVFFLGGGKRTLDTTMAGLDLVTGTAVEHPILNIAGQVNLHRVHHEHGATACGSIRRRQEMDMVAEWAEKRSTESGGKAFSLGFVTWR